MRKHIREINDDEQADKFNASKNWITYFEARNGIVLRRKTNKKKIGSEEQLPVIQKFHRQLKKDVKSSWGRSKATIDEKWGRWQPKNRYNIDQGPLPFGVDQNAIYEMKGSQSVWISQPGNGLDKCQCTLQVSIKPTDDQPVLPAIIFRGKGNVKEGELHSYQPGNFVVRAIYCHAVHLPRFGNWLRKRF
eukprot:gene2090-2366_t